MMRLGIRIALLCALWTCGGFPPHSAWAQSTYLYEMQPGPAQASIQTDSITLKNAVVRVSWSTADQKLHGGSFSSANLAPDLSLPADVFSIILADNTRIDASSMRIVDGPRLENLEPDAHASRLEARFAGKRVALRLEDSRFTLSVVWSAILRDGDNYVRQELTFTSNQDLSAREVRLFDLSVPGAEVRGTVNGSPVVAGNLFLGFEHPLSRCSVEFQQVRCAIDRELPLKAGQTVTYSDVIGVATPGQIRRAFLNYVERERAHPYRPFLHYNSWYDIGYGNRYDQVAALDVINTFGRELHEKRHVQLDSFLFDDGWDNPRSLWNFDAGFPDGFSPIKTAAEKYGAGPGIWLSPWGGYDKAKEERLKYGRQEGFETNKGGFALSGPKYFSRFRQVTLDFLQKYGINQFKIDGTGNVNSVFPHSEFDSDFHAAINLIQEWRQRKPELYVNLTTGTYPSPFWLRYADSIWRGGEDHSFAGVGPWREKWITYRDGDSYTGVVKRGPLFPLNSLMLHGIIYARQAEHLTDDPGHAFTHEVQDYFGTGTQLQEMYITHSLLTPADWDVLAEAANWSRKNAATLADTHWLGGDPTKLEVYGWAAWSPEKGIVTLRNPNNKPQTFSLDLSNAFELPKGAPANYTVHSPWLRDKDQPDLFLTAGQPHTFTLQPFQVLTVEAKPL